MAEKLCVYNSFHMKLKGVEIANFACFERQFVPVREGLNLLVGKNNSGKTALLKGIVALSALGMEDRPYTAQETRKFVNDLTGYLRGGTQDSYEANIFFDLELGDPLPITGNPASWNAFITEHSVVAIYSFWIMPIQSEDQVFFRSAELQIDGQSPLKFLSSNSEGFFYHGFEPEGTSFKEVRATRISNSGRSVMGPERKNYWLPIPTSDYSKPLLPFLRSRYVAAHRVAAPWMGIQTAEELPDTAENLSVFLQTLRGNKPRAFQQIERELKEIFPGLAFVNPATQANRVQLTVSLEGMERDVSLSHSGTGVEQVLAIVTFAVTAPPGTILFMDEPHSFLHPAAERQLIQFLKQDNVHRYVIATHSAVFINSVEADRITYVAAPGVPYEPGRAYPEIGRVLLDLGYRNSDILFYDLIIVVEGPSDRSILPALLVISGVDKDKVVRTGLPILEGAPEKLRNLQSAVTRYEKLISALSPKKLRRLYLFDGDRSPADMQSLKAMRNADGTENVPIIFLPRTEIENYLIIPKAIYAALKEEASLAGIPINVTEAEIGERIDMLLKSTDAELFPRGKKADPKVDVKGSVLLDKLFSSVDNLVYDKKRSGSLIAKHMTASDRPAVKELAALFFEFFSTES